MQLSREESSIQTHEGILDARNDGNERGRVVFSSNPPTIIPMQRPKKKTPRDMAIPFAILISMDFMIILLLWIVYVAQPDIDEGVATRSLGSFTTATITLQVDGQLVVIRNITLSQLLASLNHTSAVVMPTSSSGGTANNIESTDVSDDMTFNFEHSLFDLVFITALRGVILILAYGLVRLITRSIIVVTTMASSVIVLVKAAQFDYRRESDCDCLIYILTFFVLVFSFAFPWLEEFFLEFNYLPREMRKYKTINWYSWEAWLWPRRLPLSDSDDMIPGIQVTAERQPVTECPRIAISAATSVFVTPRTSPPRTPRAATASVLLEISEEELLPADQEYVQAGIDSLQVTEQLLGSLDGWKLEKDEGGVLCYSRSIGGKKKWRSENTINVNVEQLWHVVYNDFEKQVDWNSHVSLAQLFHKVDKYTDVSYVVAAEAGGGIITSRDFVTVRRWECVDGVYYCVGKSVTHELMPPKSGKIRGENGPGGYKLIPLDERTTRFMWLCDTDLKGWLPQYLIDQTIAGMAIQTHHKLTKHVEKLTEEDDLPLSVT